MNPQGALPIVEAVERILDIYNEHNPNPAEFSLTINSRLLKTVDVLQVVSAMLPRLPLTLGFWNLVRQYSKMVLNNIATQQTCKPSPSVLVPASGMWSRPGYWKMNKTTLKGLTEAMNNHAREWITILLLPGMLCL